MTKFFLILLMITLFVPATAFVQATAQTISFNNNIDIINIIDLSTLSRTDVNEISNDKSIKATCRINNTLITVTSDNASINALYNSNIIKSANLKEKMSQPMIARMRGIVSPFEIFKDRINIIFQEKGTVVFQASEAILDILMSKQNNHFNIIPLKGTLKFRVPGHEFLSENLIPIQPLKINYKVDSKRVSDLIKKMQDFKTRYTYTDKFIVAAKWAKKEFEKYGLKAEIATYDDHGQKQYNIVAKSSNGLAESGYYILCAHLDSISEKSTTLAPGADDNATGCAAVLEIANVLKKYEHLDKICFILFGGEEVGLKGSSAFVKSLKNEGKIKNIRGVINFDMIGYDKQLPLSALIETKSTHKNFITPFVQNAEQHIKTSVSYNPWGSDHVPFLKAKIPCFLFIEDEYANNHNYHKTTDLIDDVNIDLVQKITNSVLQTVLSLIKQSK